MRIITVVGNFMNPSLFLMISFLIAAFACNGQIRSVIIKTEAGFSLSVGNEEVKEIKSNINPVTIFYTDNLRYKLPGFRVRIAAIKPMNPFLSLGLRSGADVHYFERNTYGQRITYFSFPVQGLAEFSLLRSNSKALFFSFAAGHQFRWADEPPYHYRGGMVLSAELSFGNVGKASGLYYKVGIDYANETKSYDYVPRPDWRFTNETISWSMHRKQALVAIGANF